MLSRSVSIISIIFDQNSSSCLGITLLTSDSWYLNFRTQVLTNLRSFPNWTVENDVLLRRMKDLFWLLRDIPGDEWKIIVCRSWWEIFGSFYTPCQGALPSQGALKKLVGRKRGEVNQAPPNPATLEDLQIPERYTIYESTPGNTENFLLSDSDRTNNYVEAAHRRLQMELGVDHPTIWKLIDGLRKVQSNRDVYYEQLVAGHAPPQKLKKYREPMNGF
ncbi:hypothetical protein RN001_004276 [Aquatica leii]|uniref:Uncharacterized protein n=1 Tax=Aquatica leii TaxID=1421715 RepID=A0AAN7PZR6_9COLE|nr:hypothetical protein RN001_004276 [Aquatica leii]